MKIIADPFESAMIFLFFPSDEIIKFKQKTFAFVWIFSFYYDIIKPKKERITAMFREIVRKKQALTADECKQILKNELRGVLSVIGDCGYPYGVPINYFYNEEDGRVYFHSGRSGHKIDSIANCDKVSFCVYDSGYREEGEWALNFKSVIVFGKIRAVDDFDKAMDICRKLSYKFTDDGEYIEKEIAAFGKNTLCLELIPEHITGKRINES